MTSYEIGRKAEQAAAEFLERKGCCIIDRNWRTRSCEIDIIASRSNILYFCEVKYRSSPICGCGLDYITRAKLKQMIFASRCWLGAHDWKGEIQLCAIEVSGKGFTVTAAVTDLL